jgi:hypothetical protein
MATHAADNTLMLRFSALAIYTLFFDWRVSFPFYVLTEMQLMIKAMQHNR